MDSIYKLVVMWSANSIKCYCVINKNYLFLLKLLKSWHHLIPKILTRASGSVIIKMSNVNEKKRIESKLEVQTYLDRLNYAIESDSVIINFQKGRQVDKNRDEKHTNRYTISKIYPDEDEVDVLKR